MDPKERAAMEGDQEVRSDGEVWMWPVGEKGAAALKTFVKDRGADVSSALQKLSAKMEDLDRQVFEKGFDYMAPRSKPQEPPPKEENLRTLQIKGRITFFSMSGCEDCRAVRALLRKKCLPFVEINVDVYPHRKLELEERTGTSSLPQVFFNETFIGGIDELKAMEASRELDERLKQVFETECPDTAPLSPPLVEQSNSLSGKQDELTLVAARLKEKVHIKDRLYKMRWFTRCFVGAEAVEILAENENCSREEAVELGKKLADKFFFQHVLQENKFEDDNHLYRFLEHDPVVMTYCFNVEGKLDELEPPTVQDMESSIRKLAFAIFEQYGSEDGKSVDYQRVSKSTEFKRYLNNAHQLHRIDLLKASREEKLALFINLYNMMAVHAVITMGHPDGLLDRRQFFGDFQYLVGGCTYSLSAIENGVLRANQRPPYSLMKAFGPKDKRLKVSLLEPTPLIHFALSCATKSSPAVHCYSPANVDAELRIAARTFFRDGGIMIDADTKTVTLSQIMSWYSVDFGSSEMEILKWIIGYLEPMKAEELISLLEGEFKVVYESYDWSPNTSNSY